MAKKSTRQIRNHYSRKDVVKDYDLRRFRGFGGNYIETNEVNSNINLLNKYLKTKHSVGILDIGAGKGRLSLSLSQRGYEVYCLDSSPEMAKILEEKFSKKRVFLQSAFEPIRASIKFDVIVALRFFDHFNISDQKKLLTNFNKNLKKGGYVVFCALNKNSSEYFLSKFLNFGKMNFYYSDEEYRKMFGSLGFKIADFESRFFLPRGIFLYSQSVPILARFLMKIDQWLNKLMPRQSAFLIFLLRK